MREQINNPVFDDKSTPGIKVVIKKDRSAYQKLLGILKDKWFVSILIVLLIGLSLFVVSQEYHPIIYTNFNSYDEIHTVNGEKNESFPFSTDMSYVTIVNVTFPVGNAVRYYVLLNESYLRNGLETYQYYLIEHGYQNHSFDFNETSPNGVIGDNYVVNITAANGSTFPVNVSYTIAIPNKASNPYFLTASLVLIVSSIIALAVFFTMISTIRKGRNY